MARGSGGRNDGSGKRSGGTGRSGGNQSGGKRSGGGRRSARPQTKRHYPRTARLNTLLQEIVAGVFERIDDDRFGLVTITGVEVDNDLNKAEVFISTLEHGVSVEEDEVFLEALSEYRKPVQAAIARQASIRKTPEVVFAFDPAVRAGARIEEILSTLGPVGTSDDPEDDSPAAADSTAGDGSTARVESTVDSVEE